MGLGKIPFKNTEVFQFIVFEGIDGAGTSTHAKLLKDRLKSLSIITNVSNEPTKDSKYGIQIRKDLKDPIFLSDNRGMALKYVLDRTVHIDELEYQAGNHYNKALGFKYLPISDRYFFSSINYQCMSHPEDLDYILELNKHFPIPYLTIFIRLPVDVALTRIDSRGVENDVVEKSEFLSVLSEGYHQIYNELDSYIKDKGLAAHVLEFDAIDETGNQKDIEVLSEEIWEKVFPLIKHLKYNDVN